MICDVFLCFRIQADLHLNERKKSILDEHLKSIDLHQKIAQKKAELAQTIKKHEEVKFEHNNIRGDLQDSIDKTEANLEEKKQYFKSLLEELTRQRNLAGLTSEDELAKTVRIKEKIANEEVRIKHLEILVQKQRFMEEEEKEISYQLALSKPLVTEMLDFLNSRSSQVDPTLEMSRLITDIVNSLQDCSDQAKMFMRAAQYDSS